MAAPDRTHYDVLGISADADAAAVRSAWKLHVQAWHPDRFSGDMHEEAQRQTSRINEAYTTLRDSSRRAAYDCRLAAEAEAARPAQAAPRRAPKAYPSTPRPAAAPIGSPMVHAAVPETLSDQLAAMAGDALRILRRHPRIATAVVCVWIAVVGGTMAVHAATGPSLPSSPPEPVHAAAATSEAAITDDQTQALAKLAEEARRDAERADAEMERMMREDAAAQARAEAEAAALAAAPVQDPRAAAPGSPAVPKSGASKATPNVVPQPGGHVVRVMPSNR